MFFGWLTVLATGIITAWAWGSWGYGFSAYITTLIEEFGWSRAEISAAYSLRTLEGGLEGPWGGMACDKYGPRIISIIGIIVAGVGLISLYFINSLLQFIIVWGVIVSFGFNLGTLDPLEEAITWWFVKKRGLAIGLSRLGLAAGAGIILPFTTFLLLQFGWRLAFVIAGILTLIICVPLVWFGVKPRRPEYYGLLPDGVKIGGNAPKDAGSLLEAGVMYASEVGEVEFTLRQALRTRTFWVMFVSSTIHSLAWPITSVHLIPHLTDMGINLMVATGMLGLVLLASAPGRLLGGILADRVSIHKIHRIFVLAFGLQALSLWILLDAASLTHLVLYVILSGFGQGLQYSTGSLLVSRYFGRKAWGTIRGTDMTIRLPVSILAPIYVGWVYDTTRSYTTAFFQAAVLATLATACTYFLRPPKPPAKVTDIKSIL